MALIPICTSVYACCPTTGDGSTGAAGSAGKKNAPAPVTASIDSRT